MEVRATSAAVVLLRGSGHGVAQEAEKVVIRRRRKKAMPPADGKMETPIKTKKTKTVDAAAEVEGETK